MDGAGGRWKTPEEVMRFHRLKKRLSNRMSSTQVAPPNFSSNSTNSEDSLMEFPVVAKRKFPFPFAERNTRRAIETDESGVETDISSQSGERTLFNLLDGTHITSPSTPTSFSNLINHITPKPVPIIRNVKPVSPEAVSLSPVQVEEPKKKIPIDWSLKYKLRLMSTRPFPWSASLRTTEQVSAITGFARCLEPGKNRDGVDLDTSSNSQFHRCCLYWQHPHLPWIPLFAKTSTKLSSTLVSAQLQIAETLHTEFVTAFKSLFQLIRTQQCPYFYIIGTQFHCLFRAAGMAGKSEANALISPTTRGFRKLLEDEDIAYKMPLRKRKRQGSISSQDSDSTLTSSQHPADDSDNDDVDEAEWADSAQIRKITNAQKAKELRRESNFDECGVSMVMVTGVDLQGLFNLLVNCKNNMDRLPPTLIAPTAFQLATLKSCQVRDAVVQVDGTQLYSVQVEGPIMPHSLYQMCLLLDGINLEYSAAVATVKQTRPFTAVNGSLDEDTSDRTPSMFFLKEYLSDCGLSEKVISRLCESDPNQFGVIDSIEPQQCM